MKKYLMLLVLAACSSQVGQSPSTPKKLPQWTAPTQNAPTTILAPTVSTPIAVRTPKLVLPSNSGKTFQEAAAIFAAEANADDLYAYIRANVHELDGGNEKNVEAAIGKTRVCLNEADSVRIEWGWYVPGSQAYGGWNGVAIKQNSHMSMNAIERAGHWFHEVMHKCGFTHIENDIGRYPIIRKSWPYQAGYAFEDYVTMKQKRRIAGE